MSKRVIIYFLNVSIVIWLSSCAASRVIKPLEVKETQVGVSGGGPLIGFGDLTIPIPLSSIYVARGFKREISGFAGLNTTSLLFGVMHLDVGITKGLKKQNGWSPGISISPVTNFLIDKWEWNFRFYPQIDANVYWNYKKDRGLLYTGMSNWFELRSTTTHDEPQQEHWVPNFQIGTTYKVKKMTYSLETRYLAPNYKNDFVVVDYKGIGEKGAFGLYFSITRKL